MKDRFTITCTVDKDEKESIKKAFKDNNVNLTGYVLSCLTKRAKELSNND